MAGPAVAPRVVVQRAAPPGTPGPRPVRTRPLTATLLGVSALLVAVNVVVKVLADPPRDMSRWLQLFDVNREMNVPTVWNAVLLFAVAAACVLVAALTPARHGQGRAGWVLAAVAAVVLGGDEMLRWHEQLRSLGTLLSETLSLSLPTYSWVLPGLVVAAALTAVVLVGARGLPGDVRRLLVLGVLTFLAGALGAEAASGWVETAYGLGSAYTVVTAVEEALEMAGCVLALAAVLRMLRSAAVAGRPALIRRSDS